MTTARNFVSERKIKIQKTKDLTEFMKATSDLVWERLCLAIDGKDSCRLTRKETIMSRRQNQSQSVEVDKLKIGFKKRNCMFFAML